MISEKLAGTGNFGPSQNTYIIIAFPANITLGLAGDHLKLDETSSIWVQGESSKDKIIAGF